MPSVVGGPLTTFEDDEKESEYGYVRKVLPLADIALCLAHFTCFDFLQIVRIVDSSSWKLE